MPEIRAVRPGDLLPLISFLRNGSQFEVTAQTWPEVHGPPETRAAWGLLSRLIIRPSRSQVWVCFGKGAVLGLAMARPRAGKLAWDVEELFVDRNEPLAGVDLLEQLAADAARRGARRVFLATPTDGDLARIASRAGFVNYTSELIYSLRLPATVTGGGPRPARPRLRQDTQGLFQLYNAAVPCRVRSAEAMTLDEWLSLHRGRRPWAPSLGGNLQHFVWESQGGLVGWLQLAFAARSQHLELLVHPSHRPAAGDMLLYSLSQVSHRAPIYLSAREYQSEVLAALEGRGFSREGERLVFARELAVRVPGRVLMPARA